MCVCIYKRTEVVKALNSSVTRKRTDPPAEWKLQLLLCWPWWSIPWAAVPDETRLGGSSCSRKQGSDAVLSTLPSLLPTPAGETTTTGFWARLRQVFGPGFWALHAQIPWPACKREAVIRCLTSGAQLGANEQSCIIKCLRKLVLPCWFSAVGNGCEWLDQQLKQYLSIDMF